MEKVYNHSENDGWTTLHYASKIGRLDTAQSLIKQGIDLNVKNSDGSTPLILAARYQRKCIVDLLINSGADVNCCDEDGATVLHFASVEGWLEIAQSLINKGANLNCETSLGSTPLVLAACWEHKCIVDLLIDSGADVNSCGSKSRWTALHFASKKGWLEVVKSLIKKGANLNCKNAFGYTPLHMAANKFEIVKILLTAGANCNLEDNKGITPLSLIIDGFATVEIIGMFIQYGAYLRNIDFLDKMHNPSIKQGILQNASFCSQAIINKYNNCDLPTLYKLPLKNLPCIEAMKITTDGNTIKEIEKTVEYAIETNGHCNVLETSPIVLSMISIKSLLNYYVK